MPTEGKLYTMDMLNRIAQGEFDDDLRTANMIEAGVDPIRAREYAIQPKRLAMDAGHPDSYYRTDRGKRSIDNPTLHTPADVVPGLMLGFHAQAPADDSYAKAMRGGFTGAAGQDYVEAVQDRMSMITFALPEGYEGSDRHMREAELSRRAGEPLTEEIRLVQAKAELESTLNNFLDSRQRYFKQSLPRYRSLWSDDDPIFSTIYAGTKSPSYFVSDDLNRDEFKDMERALYRRYERVNENAEPYATEQPIEDIMQIYLDATKRRD